MSGGGWSNCVIGILPKSERERNWYQPNREQSQEYAERKDFQRRGGGKTRPKTKIVDTEGGKEVERDEEVVKILLEVKVKATYDH